MTDDKWIAMLKHIGEADWADYFDSDHSLSVYPAMLRKAVYGAVLGVEEPVFCYATRSGWMADDGRYMTDRTAVLAFAKAADVRFTPAAGSGTEQADRIALLNAALAARFTGTHRWFLRFE